jgi:Protein of unknown function (DUF1759)
MDLEFLNPDEVLIQLDDMLLEFNEHKDNFESSVLTDVEETRFRLQLVLELIPKIKQRYYFLRRKATDKPAFEAHCSPFMSTYGLLVGRMTKFAGQIPASSLESTRVAQDFSSHAPQSRSQKIKFPQIKLPEFNGSLDKWIEFRDKFESLVNGNTDLSNIEKFHYLHAAIQLPAGQQNVLQNFALSDAAYEEAWKAVCERYDDKRKLKSQHYSALLTASHRPNFVEFSIHSRPRSPPLIFWTQRSMTSVFMLCNTDSMSRLSRIGKSFLVMRN